MSKVKDYYKQTKQWEQDCIKTRRSIWLRGRRLKMFNFKKEQKILDLGCGDGLNIRILRKWGIRDIVGVDISKYLLHLARKNNPRIKFYLGSAQDLPFKDNEFDAVLADSVFHHLIDYPQSIEELRRVLKDGGRICFIDPRKSLVRRVLDWVTLSQVASHLPFFKGRKAAYLVERDLIEYWLKNENEFLNILRKNGFKKIFYHNDLLSSVGMFEKA